MCDEREAWSRGRKTSVSVKKFKNYRVNLRLQSEMEIRRKKTKRKQKEAGICPQVCPG